MQIILSKIPVAVCRKDVKNMRLCVKPDGASGRGGKVTVTAPLSMPYDEIDRFVRSKESWIIAQVQRMKSLSLKTKSEYKSGEEFFVWGRKYLLKLEYGKKNSLKLTEDNSQAIFKAPKSSTNDQKEKYIRQWYRKQLSAEITRLLPKWEKKTGLKCEIWTTRYMTSRWGSCKPKKRKICFNIQLAKKPPQCLESIILHELLHFEERYHNDRFYSLMTKYMPDWKEIRSILNGR